MKISYQTLGENINHARIKAGMQTEQLVSMLDVSFEYWERIISGKRPISLILLIQLSRILDVSIDTLVSKITID